MTDSIMAQFGYYAPHKTRPSVRHYSHFSAEADAKEIAELLKAGEANKKQYDQVAMLKVLCRRPNKHRQNIKKAFKALTKEDLGKKLKAAFSGIEENIFVALLAPPDDYDAMECYGAIKGLGTTESTLIEIFCSRTNEEIKGAIMAYRHLYGRKLSDDVAGDTSGDFRKLLLELYKADRDESDKVDPGKAKKEAETLYKAGEKRWGTDEQTFYRVLCKENVSQCQVIFQEYKTVAGHEFEVALNKEFSLLTLTGLLSLVKCIKNRPAYFAEKIHEAVKSKNYKDLVRLVVSRCEKDMVEIQEEFKRIYGMSLEDHIRDISDKKATTIKEVLTPLISGNEQ